jgi:hypothetical protein
MVFSEANESQFLRLSAQKEKGFKRLGLRMLPNPLL